MNQGETAFGPVPVVDEILRNSDPLEDRLGGPCVQIAACDQYALASIRIRNAQNGQARMNHAVRANVIDYHRWRIGAWRQDKTYKTRDLIGSAASHRDAICRQCLPGSSPGNILRLSGIRVKCSETGQRNTGSIVGTRGSVSPGRESYGGRGEINTRDVPADFVVTRGPNHANRQDCKCTCNYP